MSLTKVIIWGYPLHSHTHSYIHYAWEKTFKHLGYEVYWFDDNNYPSINNFEYKNTLFITEGYADNNIPLDKSNTYFVHVCINPYKYTDIGARLVDIRYNVSSIYDCNYNYNLDDKIINNKAKLIHGSTVNYYENNSSVDDLNKNFKKDNIDYEAIYICWATDLLPHEINYNDRFIKPSNPPIMYYIGTIGSGNNQEIQKLYRGCNDNGIKTIHIDPWKSPISFTEAQKLIQESYISPDIRGSGDQYKKFVLKETGTCHKEIGYIPCRLFKNISYGKLGAVNACRLKTLFGSNVLYSDDEYELAKICIDNRENYDYIYDQMKWVAENHTYINRVNDILTVLGYKNQKLSK